MEWTVKRINAETFKFEGEIEIHITQDDVVSGLRNCLRVELEKHRAWLKETLKTIQVEKSTKPTKRLLTVKETAQYLGISPGTIYNRQHEEVRTRFQ